MKKKFLITSIISVIILIIILYITYFLSNKDINAYVVLNINEDEITITKDNILNNIDLTTLNTKYDTQINIKSENAKVYINGDLVNNKYILKNLELNKTKPIKVKIKFKNSLKKYIININTLPSDFPNYETVGVAKTNQEYYLSTYYTGIKTNHYVYILNKEGKVTFYRRTNKDPFSFKKEYSNNKVYYTYLETINHDYDGYNESMASQLVVLDENFKFIKNIRYKTDTEYFADNHDYYFFSEDHYILAGYSRKDVIYENRNYKLWDLRISEVKDGKVIWEFKGSDYNRFIDSYNYVFPLYDGVNYVNIMHINSMTIDPEDGNLVCSLRNQDSIIKINRNTGKLMWVLGGKSNEFETTEDHLFSKQHSISYLPNHEMLIYDNGEVNGITRILKIKLDEKNKKVLSFKSYELNNFAPRLGSIFVQDYENDIYLLTYGSGSYEYAVEQINLEDMSKYWQFKIKTNNSLLYTFSFD